MWSTSRASGGRGKTVQAWLFSDTQPSGSYAAFRRFASSWDEGSTTPLCDVVVLPGVSGGSSSTTPPVPLQPDDPRLVDLVRLTKLGISESIIAEQVRQSGRAFTLSVNDLLYLKQNGLLESITGALKATRAAPGAAVLAPAAGRGPSAEPSARSTSTGRSAAPRRSARPRR